jgi:hypothetical protein
VLSEKALAVPLPAALVASTLAYVSGKSANAAALSAKVFALSEGVLRMLWLNKMKMAAGVVLALVLAGTGIGLVVSQTWGGGGEGQVGSLPGSNGPVARSDKTESDEDFIRRMSKDLLGKEPTAAEVHFFVTSKDPKRREKLIDLFTVQRQAKKTGEAETAAAADTRQQARAERLQRIEKALAHAQETIKEMRRNLLNEIQTSGAGDPAHLTLKQKALLEVHAITSRRLIDLDNEALLLEAAQKARGEEGVKEINEKLKILQEQRAVLRDKVKSLAEKADMIGRGSFTIDLLRAELAEVQEVAKTLRRERDYVLFGLDELKAK